MARMLRHALGLALVGIAGFSSAADIVHTAGKKGIPAPTLQADPFRCDHTYCAVPTDGTYPFLVIGQFKAQATDEQGRRLFKQMQPHHPWKDLPPDADEFLSELQPVSIVLPANEALAVVMPQSEIKAARPKAGDLVRYSPHRGDYEVPPQDPKERAYWAVDGCVAVLCRAGDKSCFAHYAQGVFRPEDGVAISPHTYRALPNAVVIDTATLLPKQVSK